MISFEITHESKKSGARTGILHTPHGDIETPAFVPVATRGSVRALMESDIEESGAQLLIANTFHLHLTPGEDRVAKFGGLHKFMHANIPLMTDSGGFQVFSMGFGTDHGIGKTASGAKGAASVEEGTQPQKIKITEDGVHFRSPLDGAPLYLDPQTSIAIQEKIGADIMFAFDECPPPNATKEYIEKSMHKTHRWAQESLNARTGEQALYGIVQGGAHKDLRTESAKVIASMNFDGFGIGGEFGYEKSDMEDMLRTVTNELPKEKPRHLLGVGHPEDFEYIARGGADTFDCIAPTHYARHGTVFTSVGRLNMLKSEMQDDERPLDPNCDCKVCKNHSRAYIAHLFRANELTALSLATFHNLYYLNNLAREIREKIKADEL